MYKINHPPIVYSDPWQTPFDKRVKELAKGHKRVAYYYDNLDNSTFRYRVYNMIQALCSLDNEYSAAYFISSEIDYLDRIIEIADVLVICRAKYTHKLNRLITKAKNKNKTVIFDVDDLVFEPEYIHLLLDTLDQDLNHPNVWDFWYAYVGRIRASLNLCDRVITTNEYLAKKIANCTNKNASVIPNFLNLEQLAVSDEIYSKKITSQSSRDDHFHIGYFSGTPSHNKDLGIAADALIQLLKDNPKIILRIVGYMEIKGELADFTNRIERVALQDFINLQRLIGEVEVNIIPLQNNEFTNCKSELKFFEAAIVGTISIATPIFTYQNSVQEGETGYLAKSFEWYDKLSALVNKYDETEQIVKRAYLYCKERYAWYNQIDLIKNTLFPTEINSTNFK